MDLLAPYAALVSGDAPFALAAALAVMTACTASGALIGRDTRGGGDVIVGTGLLGGLLALWGGAGLPVSAGAAGLGAFGLAALVWRLRQGAMPGGTLWRTALILAPLALVAAGSIATMWDDFFHWLPNAAYVWRYDRLPLPGGPESLSKWPAYPHTLPFIAASVSWLTGRFQENAGPIANVVFLAAFAAMLAEILTKGLRPGLGLRWAAAGAGAVLATALNPAFDANVLFASYSDVATAVAVAACGAFGSGTIGMLARGRRREAVRLAWRFAFAATALINLKQANAVLLALMVAGFALLALSAGRQTVRAAFRRLPILLGPPVLVFAVWRVHVLTLGTTGEMSFRAPSAWNWDVFDRTLAQVGRMMLEAPAFFALMYATTALGLWAWARRPDSTARRLLALTAVVWIGYNAFLALVYLGAMTAEEASNAADYWRYTPHVGYLALLAAVAWIAEVAGQNRALVRRLPRFWPLAPAVLALAIPTAAVLAPVHKPWPMHFRQAGREAGALLPEGARVAILGTYHLDPVGTAWIFDLSGQTEPADRDTRGLLHPGTLDDAKASVGTGAVTHALITDYFWRPDKEEQVLGLPELHDETALFRWTGEGWDKLGSWPVPPRPRREP
jgi:hypothetical protein